MDIFVLDKSFNRTALIDIYDSFIWTDRYYDCGDFELVVPANEKMLSILRKELYLSINDSEFTMIIEGIELKTSLEEGNELIVTGRDLTSILDRRVVWQQTQCNGDFQNQIKKLLNENLISPTDSARRIPNLIFQASTDPKITGLTVDTQFTGDNIFESIKKLCKHERVGFKITLNSSKQMVFQLYMGVDRTFNQTENTAIEFSPRFDNLLNTDYVTSNKPYKNVTLIGGEGEGAERRFSTLGDATGLDRREIFTDARSVSSKVTDDQGNQVEISDADYNSQLQQKGQETLTKNIAVETFNGEVNANVQWLYGRDYYLGDIVQIRNEYGTEGTTRIIEVIRCDDTQNGLQTYPTFKSDAEDEDEVSGSTGTTTGGGSGTSYDPSTVVDVQSLDGAKLDKDGDGASVTVTFDETADPDVTSFAAFLSSIVSGLSLSKLLRVIKTGLNYIAPKNHAANDVTYGGGDAVNYGHIRLSDVYTKQIGTAAQSIGASQKAVADAYTVLNSNFHANLVTNGQVTSGYCYYVLIEVGLTEPHIFTPTIYCPDDNHGITSFNATVYNVNNRLVALYFELAFNNGTISINNEKRCNIGENDNTDTWTGSIRLIRRL